MKEYIVDFCKRACEIINPGYARSRKMDRFDALDESGDLDSICNTEFHELFGIRKWSNEF